HQHRASEGTLGKGHDLEARRPERADPRRDAGRAPDPRHLHRRGDHRADLPCARHWLPADHGDPRQRHARDHGHQLRLRVPGGHLQPRGRPALRLARSADLVPLMAEPTTRSAAMRSSSAETSREVLDVRAPGLGTPEARGSRFGGRAKLPSEGSLRRARGGDTLWSDTWRRFRRHHLAIFGGVVLAAMVVAVLGGPLIYRVPIDQIDFKAKLKGPSWAHPLGTDDLGQDVLARMLYGGRISLAVGVAAMLIAISVGTA